MRTMTTEDEHIRLQRAKLVRDVLRRAYSDFRSTAANLDQQTALIGALHCGDIVRQGMLVIADLGVTFAAEDAQVAVEALGMVMCRVAVIAALERWAVQPILELGIGYSRDVGEQPIRAAGDLAAALMAPRQERQPAPDPVAGDCALVDALAVCVAKAIDDVTMQHELEIVPIDLYQVIAAEVIAGKLPRTRWTGGGCYEHVDHPLNERFATTPLVTRQQQREFTAQRKSAAMKELTDAVDGMIQSPPREIGGPLEPWHTEAPVRGPDGDAVRPSGMFAMLAAEIDHAHAHISAKEAEFDAHGYDRTPTNGLVGLEWPARLTTPDERARYVADRVRRSAGNDPVATQLAADLARDHRLTSTPAEAAALAATGPLRLCEQCGAIMSDVGDGMESCRFGHRTAIVAASTADDTTG